MDLSLRAVETNRRRWTGAAEPRTRSAAGRGGRPRTAVHDGARNATQPRAGTAGRRSPNGKDRTSRHRPALRRASPPSSPPHPVARRRAALAADAPVGRQRQHRQRRAAPAACPGVGPAVAAHRRAPREERPLQARPNLMLVKGIGEKSFETAQALRRRPRGDDARRDGPAPRRGAKRPRRRAELPAEGAGRRRRPAPVRAPGRLRAAPGQGSSWSSSSSRIASSARPARCSSLAAARCAPPPASTVRLAAGEASGRCARRAPSPSATQRTSG